MVGGNHDCETLGLAIARHVSYACSIDAQNVRVMLSEVQRGPVRYKFGVK